MEHVETDGNDFENIGLNYNPRNNGQHKSMINVAPKSSLPIGLRKN